MGPLRRTSDSAIPNLPLRGRLRQSLAVPLVLLLGSAAGMSYFANGLSTAAFTEALPGYGCNIKGNTSVEPGERIYHVPGQDYYSKTIIVLNSASAGSARRRKHAKMVVGGRKG
jgi:hypothetical protein